MSGDFAEIMLIVLLGAATYAMRLGGYLVLSRFGGLNPRVEAALDAVPASVIAALVAPVALATGIAETLAAGITVFAALRLPIIPTLLVGGASAALLRAAGL